MHLEKWSNIHTCNIVNDTIEDKWDLLNLSDHRAVEVSFQIEGIGSKAAISAQTNDLPTNKRFDWTSEQMGLG